MVEYRDKEYINRYHVPVSKKDTKALTKKEEERNRRANILRGAIDLMLDIRNMGIHGVEDMADEDQIPDKDYKIFIKVNKVLVEHMLDVEPLLTQGRPVCILFVRYVQYCIHLDQAQ